MNGRARIMTREKPSAHNPLPVREATHGHAFV